MSAYSSPLDHLGRAFLWTVVLIVAASVAASCSLGLVWLIVWVFGLGTRVLALAGLPWLLLAGFACFAPLERGHVLVGSVVTAAMCIVTAWWLS